MEVFLRNLPQYMTDGALHQQLQPFMDQLSITDYLAEKRRNKTIGHITFLRQPDGARFLHHHQEELLPEASAQPHHRHHRHRQHKHPPTRPRLSLMGNPVFCKLSDRGPDEYALKSIQHESTQHLPPTALAEPAIKALQATELNCGYYSLADGRLAFVPEWTANESCLVRFSKRSLLITLDKRQVQLRIPFQSIVELVWGQNGNAAVSLRWAPTILGPQAEDDLAGAFAMLDLGRRQPSQYKRLEAIDENHRRIASLCLVYHFTVPNPIMRHAKSDLESELARMRDNFHVTRHDFAFQRPVGMGFASAAASLRNQLAQYNMAGSLPFGLLLLLQALVNNGYLHPDTVSALSRTLVQRFAEARKAGADQLPVSVDAFKRLFDWIDYPTPHGDPSMFEVDGIMEYLGEAERHVRGGSGLRLNQELQSRAHIFKAMVTPTRVTLHGPELEPMNRLLRKYPDHSYFIRAQFCDEDGQDLFFSSKISLDPIYSRFKSVLTRGIQVAGRVYTLLGFSHSSLRTHSAWLSAPFVHEDQMQIPATIITGLGRFDKIRSPARQAARIGQAFSETPYAVDLDENGIQVLEIKDVERNGRMFSDGIGTISLAAADAVYRALPKSKGFPTAFQVRLGGAKGMLVVDPLLQGGSVCVRPSMIKFESNDRELEICDVASKPMPMVLNHQLIKILEDMGAPDTWFLGLQSRELRRLRRITATVYNTANFLRSQKIGESIQLSGLLRQVEAMGIDYRTDGFLRGAVEVVLLRELCLLKRKARIPVCKGMTLFGVMDETGFLEENQVYVAYDDEGRHSEPPGPGKVIVTRSPALHPGDVQLATNTLPPNDEHPLAHHRNCIVFSRRGKRDLPSQLSGGDLDGDVFHVIWDPEVVGAVTTFLPADYTRVPPLELGRLVETADIANFFVDFMQTDHLGVIATRHKVVADQKDDGTLDLDCIKLAELHSSAVDFSKTGRAVELSELPRSSKWRPDFLVPGPSITIFDKSAISLDEHSLPQGDEDDEGNEEGPRFRYYQSEKILGQLYRAVDEQNIWAQDIKMTVHMARGPPFWDQLLAALEERASTLGPIEWRNRVSEARIIQHTYEDAILGVMVDSADHPHQPLGELEVFVGFVINKSGVQARRQRDSSVKLKEEFEHITAGITREMRNPTAPTGGLFRELGALELCLACLNVGCERQYRELRPGHRISSQDLQSFKIVAAAAVIRELAVHESRFHPHRYTGS